MSTVRIWVSCHIALECGAFGVCGLGKKAIMVSITQDQLMFLTGAEPCTLPIQRQKRTTMGCD